MVTVTIPKSVTSIGEHIFRECSNLGSIIVDNENEIYDSRDNCNAIIETKSNTLISGCCNTVIPNSVTTIGILAFSGISHLTSVTIPNSVTSIGGGAFRNCQGLTSVTIPQSVTSIGEGAFEWCSYLTSLSVENGNTVYDSRNNCNAIIETKSNTLIAGCNTTIIPSSVTIIGQDAFIGCQNLTSIVIPYGVTTIKVGAFWNCYALSSMTISSTVTSISPYIFNECMNLKVIKSEIEEPFAIGKSVFSGISSDARLEVLYGTKEKYQALSGWTYNFKEIVELDISSPIISFADSNVKAICVANWDTDGDGELSEEEAAAVKDLGTAFKGNVSLTSFNELEYFTGLTSISDSSFSKCSSITSIIIPNSVKTIGVSAFKGCSGLTSITIGNSVVTISKQAFYDCAGLISVIIPNSVTSIGDFAFTYCKAIISINLPMSINNIGVDCFLGCKSLNEINIPNLTELNDGVFWGTALTSVVIPNTVKSIGPQVFNCCSQLENVIIGENVISIGHHAFSSCVKLKSITIPDSVKIIEHSAFLDDFGLTSITIGSGISSIGGWCFIGCSNLFSVTILAKTPPLLDGSTPHFQLACMFHVIRYKHIAKLKNGQAMTFSCIVMKRQQQYLLQMQM